jgi:MtfA peptidase
VTNGEWVLVATSADHALCSEPLTLAHSSQLTAHLPPLTPVRVARPSSVAFLAAIAILLAIGLAVVGAQVDGLSAWIGLAPLLLVPALGLRRALRRWRAVQRPFPEAWRQWLDARSPVYRHADPTGRRRFEQDVQMVLAEARFDAVEGVDLDDDLRLSVAAGAATLLHGRPDWELDLSRTFLFYPDTFDDEYLVEGESDYDGMVHPQGPVLLSAHAARAGWAHPEDGSNVVLHELAHLFDFADAPDADGVPTLLDPASAKAWIQLAHREMALARRGRSMLGRYAASHPAEFFAVATERFFERPERLAERHPELFDALVALYNLDPRAEETASVVATTGPSLMARRWRQG